MIACFWRSAKTLKEWNLDAKFLTLLDRGSSRPQNTIYRTLATVDNSGYANYGSDMLIYIPPCQFSVSIKLDEPVVASDKTNVFAPSAKLRLPGVYTI